MVGLLHSTTASGRPLTNTTTSGMTCFFDPSTLYCRVTTHSLRPGSSKSRNRTVWLRRPFAPILLQRDAVGERRVERLVGLGETGGGNLRDRLHGPGDVGVGEPGIQPLEGGGEAAGEDGLLEARAFAFEAFRRDVGVAEGL